MESMDLMLGGGGMKEDGSGRTKAERLLIVESDQEYSAAIRYAMRTSERRVSVIRGSYVGPSEPHAADADLIILDMRK